MISVAEALAGLFALSARSGPNRAAAPRPRAASWPPRHRPRDQPPFAASAMDGYACAAPSRCRAQLR
jgi:hypothetical protein